MPTRHPLADLIGQRHPHTGALILDAKQHASHEPMLLLCFLDHGHYTEWVTWAASPDTLDAFSGHYFQTFDDAARDYTERIAA